MTDKQRLDNEINPLIRRGLLVKVLDVDGLTVCRLANTGYVAFLHGLREKQTGHSIGFNLIGQEFDMLMHYPNVDTFQQINFEAVQKGEKRAVVLTPALIAKFTQLKNKVDAMPENPYINPALEAELIEIAKKAQAPKKSGFFGRR